MIAALLAVMAAVTPVGVSAREYRWGVYRSWVPRGTASFRIHDYGEDAHNLQIRGPHGFRSRVSHDVEPGANLAFTVRLRRRGRYILVCRKPGHAARGMRATIRVR